MARLCKVKTERFIDVDIYGSKVRLTVALDFVERDQGATVCSFKLSKRETTELIKMLKSQRARKGIR